MSEPCNGEGSLAIASEPDRRLKNGSKDSKN